MQLIQHLNYLWLLICCLSCFGNCLSIDNQKSDQSIDNLFSSTSTTEQQLISTTDMLNNLPSIFERKLVKWKKSLANLRRDLIDVEKSILDPNSSKEKLIKLHRKAFNDLEKIEKRMFQYIQQLNTKKLNTIDKSIVTVNQDAKIENVDQIDQQLDSTNQVKIQVKDPNFFFSSSTSKPQSQSVFWLSDASASSIGNLSTFNSGKLSSFANYSSNFNSSNSLNLSSNLKLPIESLYQSKTNELINTIPVDLNLDNLKIINSNNNSSLSDKKLISSSIHKKVKKKRHSFLLFHKCSQGYVQINRTNNYNLNTGMNLELLSNSELIINFLKKPNNHQLHMKTKNGKYLCFGVDGKPNIMGELNKTLCTFNVIFHKNDNVQLTSILNDDWALGFDKLGIPMKASQQKKRKNLQKTFPNPCTLFVRQRSDNQLLQRLIELKIEQKNNKNKNRKLKKQIEEIKKINNPLIQDSLIMDKINRLRQMKDD